MSVIIEFYNPVGRGGSHAYGPFSDAAITHRRLWGNGRQLAVRGARGAWEAEGRAFLAARVRTADAAPVKLSFAEGWAPNEQPRSRQVRELRLSDERLWLGRNATPLATDDDDSRCWVSEPDGQAYDRLLVE